jgi:hypothetical protein
MLGWVRVWLQDLKVPRESARVLQMKCVTLRQPIDRNKSRDITPITPTCRLPSQHTARQTDTHSLSVNQCMRARIQNTCAKIYQEYNTQTRQPEGVDHHALFARHAEGCATTLDECKGRRRTEPAESYRTTTA